MARDVSQEDIAEALGIDRTTVSKILNRDPNYGASKETRDRVFALAEKLGYDFIAVRRPYRREYRRAELNAPAKFTILTENGETFDKGECVVNNLSVGGALLSNLKCKKMALPLANFTVRLRLAGAAGLSRLEGECELARFAREAEMGEPELGVRFVNLSDKARCRIEEFVASRFPMRRED